MSEFDPFTQTVSTAGLTEEDLRAPEVQEEEAGAGPDDTTITTTGPVSVTAGGEWSWVKAEETEIPITGTYFAYDLETVPDESRYPKPEEVKVEPRKFEADKVLKTVDTIKEFLAEGCCEEDALALLDFEQANKSRKGAIAAIRSFIDSGNDEMKEWHKRGTNPWELRIVALGICYYDNPVPVVMTAKTVEEERKLLRYIFDVHDNPQRVRVGYNISTFDDKVLLARGMILGVYPDRKLELSRWSKQRVDLARVLFDGIQDMRALKPLLYDVGIIPPAGDVDGSMVLEMVENEQWGMLAEYVASDAWAEMELFKRRVQRMVAFG